MQNDSDALLLARLGDAVVISRKRPGFVGFLNEHELAAAEDFLRRKNSNHIFWGGAEFSERKILGIFPDFIEPDIESFPLKALSMTYRERDSLSHRDFLGAFMSLGLKRETIGDILIESGRCVVFVKEEMQRYILENIRKIGSTGIKISDEIEFPLPAIHEYKELKGVVASKRLDCIVAFLCHLSRDKSAGLIKSGLVQCNHREILSPSAVLSEGDVLSIKQKGKFLLESFGSSTAKGRLVIHCKKYI